MASQKASAGERAKQFLAQVGTAGGPVGSLGLVGFGASDLYQQLQAGLTDEYAAIRARSMPPKIGSQNAPQPLMPADLDASYLKLNLPGSPLPRNGLLTAQFVDAAQYSQDQIIANEQRMLMPYMPLKGTLPMSIQPPMPRKKGGR